MELSERLHQDKPKLQKSLLDWYATNRGEFPWCNINNPFEVLLTENCYSRQKPAILLFQSTQIETHFKYVSFVRSLRRLRSL